MGSGGNCHDYKFLIKRWRILSKQTGLKLRKFTEVDHFPCYEVASEHQDYNRGIYISAGIHGDEPAGTEALLSWAESRKDLLKEIPVVIYPCFNPWGLMENSRFDSQSRDLNRQWDKEDSSVITEVIKRTAGIRFSLAVNLHEDYDANGIYLYEPPRRGSPDKLSSEILAAGQKYVAIDSRKKIEGRWARNGIIRPAKSSLPVEGLPEAAFLQNSRADRTFVFETPSEKDLSLRVKAQIAMLDQAIQPLVLK